MVSGTRELLLRGGREERSHRAMSRPLVKLMGDLQRYGDLIGFNVDLLGFYKMRD